jgi:hypothetical protein
MGRFRLFIEGKEVDVPDGLSAQLTYSIDDIKDFASRNTSFSKTIVLPGTGRNKRIFGHVFELGSANFYDSTLPNIEYNYNATKAAKALITYDNIQIFKGVLQILEIIVDGDRVEFETSVFGEFGGFYGSLGEKKLENLDFSAYDHVYNAVNVGNAWSAVPGSGYYYPLIDYGYTADGITFPIENFRPAFHVKEYLDKIFAAAGYTFESTFLNSDLFKKLIVPFNGQFPGLEVATVHHSTDASHVVTDLTNLKVQFDSVVTSKFDYSDFKHFYWRRLETVSLKYEFSCNWSRDNGGSVDVQAIIYTGVDEATMTPTHIYNETTSATSGTINVSGKVDAKPNEFVMIGLAMSTFGTITFTDLVFKLVGQPTVNIPIAYGDTVSCNNMLPKGVLQKDFLVWVIKMFNLYIVEDRDREKHLKIEPYIDFYDGESPAIDWDQKIDRDQVIKLKPMGEWNSRLYEFVYKSDGDYFNDLYKKKWNEVYGSYLFDSGNEFSSQKKTVEVGFSPTPSIQYDGTNRVIPAIYKKTNTTIERTASNIRILLRAGEPVPCGRWYITYTIPGQTEPTTNGIDVYPYAGHLDDPDAPTFDLNFGVPKELYFTLVTGNLSANLVNVFWSYYLSETTDKDSKVLTAFFRLTTLDIYQLNFARFIYLGGVLWRLNAVVDYTTEQPELTKVELLKVRDLPTAVDSGDGGGGEEPTPITITVTEISNTNTGVGGTRTQVFYYSGAAASDVLPAGIIFGVGVYSHEVEYTTTGTQTLQQALQNLVDLVNATTEAQWDEFGSAPATGTPGYPPFASLFSPTAIRLQLNYQNQFAAWVN